MVGNRGSSLSLKAHKRETSAQRGERDSKAAPTGPKPSRVAEREDHEQQRDSQRIANSQGQQSQQQIHGARGGEERKQTPERMKMRVCAAQRRRDTQVQRPQRAVVVRADESVEQAPSAHIVLDGSY